MNSNKKRTAIAIIVIILAIAAAIFGIPYLAKVSNAQESVVVAATTIPKNTIITIEQLELKQVNVSAIPANAAKDTTELVGKYAVTDITLGDFMTANKVESTLATSDEMKTATEKGKVVISVSLESLQDSVSGKLVAGDVVMVVKSPINTTQEALGNSPTVSVLNSEATASATAASEDASATESTSATATTPAVVFTDESAQYDASFDLLKNIEVCSLTTATGKDANAVAVDGEAANEVKTPATITLFVTQEQAEALIKLQDVTTLHFAFIARGEDRVDFVSADQIVIP